MDSKREISGLFVIVFICLLTFTTSCSGKQDIYEAQDQIDEVNLKSDSIDESLNEISKGLYDISKDTTGYKLQ